MPPSPSRLHFKVSTMHIGAPSLPQLVFLALPPFLGSDMLKDFSLVWSKLLRLPMLFGWIRKLIHHVLAEMEVLP